jgi:6-phosphogluconolactonase
MSILDTRSMDTVFTGVFVQTNEKGTNRVLAFRRGADGALEQAGGYPTGGAGLGAAHLGSQGSVILTTDGRHLLVTNAGSDDISVSL